MAKDATVLHCSPKSLKKPKLPMPEKKLLILRQPNIRLPALECGGLPPLCGVTHTAA
jgi:hypothetical protein